MHNKKPEEVSALLDRVFALPILYWFSNKDEHEKIVFSDELYYEISENKLVRVEKQGDNFLMFFLSRASSKFSDLFNSYKAFKVLIERDSIYHKKIEALYNTKEIINGDNAVASFMNGFVQPR